MSANNIEVIVTEWLNSFLDDGWEASGDKPKSTPVKYVLVDRTGGGREAMVLDRAEILIEIYHKNSRITASDKANDIADRVIELCNYNENITRAVVNSMVNLDDVISQYHRYQVYCDVYHRR